MNIRSNFNTLIKLSLLIGSVFFCLTSYAQDDLKSNIPDFKMNGDVSLLSNFVEHGLTQTNSDPSLQGAFSFNFGPQFKVGLWGSNVNYQSTEHFLLKLNAELKVQISTNADFKFGYNLNNYFKTQTRNGNLLYLVVTIHGYRIRYESNSNWEGSETKSKYYSFGKLFDLSTYWKWDNEVGYTTLNDVPSMENYFDIRTTFFYKGGGSNITYLLSATATSAPSQFKGQGDVFAMVGAETTF